MSKNTHCIETCIEPISLSKAFKYTQDPQHGGCAQFIGTVRNHNCNRPVVAIEYEVLHDFFVEAVTEHFQHLAKQFDDRPRLYVAHAHGKLMVGDIAVLVSCSATHRQEAQFICHEIIELIKHKATVWKKEYFADGHGSAWSDGYAL